MFFFLQKQIGMQRELFLVFLLRNEDKCLVIYKRGKLCLKVSFLYMFYNKEGIDFEKYFKVYVLLRLIKLNRWYIFVIIGNICI